MEHVVLTTPQNAVVLLVLNRGCVVVVANGMQFRLAGDAGKAAEQAANKAKNAAPDLSGLLDRAQKSIDSASKEVTAMLSCGVLLRPAYTCIVGS